MWKLRYWKSGQPRPEDVVEVYTDRDIGAQLQHAIDTQGYTRVEAVRQGHVAAPPPLVKAQRIEWREEEHPKGEEWVGYIGDRMVARVFRYTYEGVSEEHTHYTLFLGGGDNERYVACSSVELGKRLAQRALNKIVRTLVGG